MRVGMFMSSPTGTCKATFTMPHNLTWSRFWITPSGQRTAVIAAS
jgi:hypothetical protein